MKGRRLYPDRDQALPPPRAVYQTIRAVRAEHSHGDVLHALNAQCSRLVKLFLAVEGHLLRVLSLLHHRIAYQHLPLRAHVRRSLDVVGKPTALDSVQHWNVNHGYLMMCRGTAAC